MTNSTKPFFPAEWAWQCAILITWPYKETDWAYMLDEINDCYMRLTVEVAQFAPVLVVCPPECTVAEEALMHIAGYLGFFHFPYNDTWIRDYGPITTITPDGVRVANDFVFNGWGLKFAANLDNMLNRTFFDALHRVKAVDTYQAHLDFVLEGGAIDSNGEGALLTTASCMESPNRNASLSREQIIDRLKHYFGCDEVIYLYHGYLEGDDTDGHVDNLARFLPGNRIAYTTCDRKDDPHYEELALMEKELEATGRELVPLPIPNPIYDENGHRLPASYANFLFLNDGLFVPTYNDEHYDAIAIERLTQALPNFQVIPIDCRALIKQHGSLHCAIMQLPHVKKS